ncbi:hypothetical protein HMPREF0493_1330 [Lactobacillus amylolyticus DSM 11664]|uniref:Uncharacterized protein n=1 Tax=Lactobacillus amylolyticus DSM 11664 TaxID=585524 RepID=D4YUW9_9LACO|nr:hypothetical protein HMPREF0493_1330 [Lactobacillus amylolyticus DSM 11664]
MNVICHLSISSLINYLLAMFFFILISVSILHKRIGLYQF